MAKTKSGVIIVVIILLLAIIAAIVWFIYFKPVNSVTYTCDGKKTIQAKFYKNKVDLKLSDNRTFNLPQVESASGARYANENEVFVFWDKGGNAFITESGKTTFKNCVVKK